jgi:hypothetical protein
MNQRVWYDRNVVPNLPDLLKGSFVNVEFCGVHAKGFLIYHSEGVRGKVRPHRPEILILEAPEGKTLLRGWDIMSFMKRR